MHFLNLFKSYSNLPGSLCEIVIAPILINHKLTVINDIFWKADFNFTNRTQTCRTCWIKKSLKSNLTKWSSLKDLRETAKKQSSWHPSVWKGLRSHWNSSKPPLPSFKKCIFCLLELSFSNIKIWWSETSKCEKSGRGTNTFSQDCMRQCYCSAKLLQPYQPAPY